MPRGTNGRDLKETICKHTLTNTATCFIGALKEKQQPVCYEKKLLSDRTSNKLAKLYNCFLISPLKREQRKFKRSFIYFKDKRHGRDVVRDRLGYLYSDE